MREEECGLGAASRYEAEVSARVRSFIIEVAAETRQRELT